MKIFKTKDGKETVYVQLKDLIYITNRYFDRMPRVISKKIGRQLTFIGITQQYMFMPFTDKEAVDFFKSQNYIIDFDDFRNMPIAVIEDKYHEIVKETAKVAEEMFAQLDSKDNIELDNKHGDINFKLSDITQIYNWKLGKEPLVLPDFDL